MFWPFNCFKKKQDPEKMRIKQSKSYLCTNQDCKSGSFFTYKEAEHRDFKCSYCLHNLKLV
jgi:hypothetical protein